MIGRTVAGVDDVLVLPLTVLPALFGVGVLLWAVPRACAVDGSTPDPLIGIRTRATKSSPEAWVGGHRAALPLARTSGQLSLPFTAAVIAAVAAGASAVVPEATAAVLAAAGLLTVLGTGTAASIVADRAARRPQ